MSFVLITIAVWLIYIVALYRVNKVLFSFPNILLPLLLFSILVTIDLGFNYLAGGNPLLNDGISIHGFLAYLIIGDDGWTLDLFYQYYKTSFLISCVLLLLYIATYFLGPLRKQK